MLGFVLMNGTFETLEEARKAARRHSEKHRFDLQSYKIVIEVEEMKEVEKSPHLCDR